MTFKKGVSGNPHGQSVTSKKLHKHIRELLMHNVPRACEVITECLEESDNKTWAAKEVLDRIYGKAAQTVDVGGEAGQALTAVLKIISKKD